MPYYTPVTVQEERTFEDLRNKIILNCEKEIKEKFSEENHLKQLLNIFNNTLK